MEKSNPHHYINTIDQVITDAIHKGISQLTHEESHLGGVYINVRGRPLVSFGSCSYLGIERHPKLVEGVIEAVQKFGVQFSSSRVYLSVALYDELEVLLREMFGQSVVIAASTTLGHMAALPVLVGDGDAIILDHQVHASVSSAAQVLKPRGIPVHIIRHNRLDQLEEMIQHLSRKYHQIWYMADGVYSMYGDFAPMHELVSLLERYPQLNLYVDDAHGMSWTGKNGCGYTHSQIAHHPRLIRAVSLNKAFACAGGALIFPNPELARRVRNCGSTLLFSGPIQPPMLGAAVASARIHLSDEIYPLQECLAERIAYTRNALQERGLPLLSNSGHSPIFFIASGLPKVAYNIINRLCQDGYYVNAGAFPATPMAKGGLRFTLTANHTHEQIDGLADRIAAHYADAVREEKVSPADIERSFGKVFSLAPLFASPSSPLLHTEEAALRVETYETISQIDAAEWDQLYGSRGAFTAQGMALLERVFGAQEKPEHRWKFVYILIRDKTGKVVLAAPCTLCLAKDDMLSPADVSRQIEERRQNDPYWLTSQMLMVGTPCSEGEHLYLDRQHPQWREALEKLLPLLSKYQHEWSAETILIRDLSSKEATELKEIFLTHGLIALNLPERFEVNDMTWKTPEDFAKALRNPYRQHLRKEILSKTDEFRVETEKNIDESTRKHCFQLYKNVHEKSFDINAFALPYELFEAYFETPEFDVVRLYLRDTQTSQAPVAVMFSHYAKGVYSAGIVGLDYRFVKSHAVYKQILYQSVLRARDCGARHVQLGFTSGLVKKKAGANPVETHGFLLASDHYNHSVVESFTVAAHRAPSIHEAMA